MLLAICIRLAPSNVNRKVGQENLPAISQATTPPSMTGTKVACKNGTRIALSHNPMKGGFFTSTPGFDDILGYLPVSKKPFSPEVIQGGSVKTSLVRGLGLLSSTPGITVVGRFP